MKTVLITGTGKGIGAALAKEFLDAGWQVIGTYHKTKPTMSHENYKIYQSDVSKQEENAELIKTLKNDNIHLDILINNAGISGDDKDANLGNTAISTDELKKVLSVNLIGLVDLTEQALDLMDSESHLVNISSHMGAICDSPGGNRPSYRISKCAVNMYTRTLVERVGDNGPTISAVHPGRVSTDMGGPQATMSPEEAGKWIHEFAIRDDVPTGKFWNRGEQDSW